MAAVKGYIIQILLITAVSTVYGVYVTTPAPDSFLEKLLQDIFRSKTSAPYQNPCSRLMCFNGATCFSFTDEDAWCDCLPGYSGTQCLETEFNKDSEWRLSPAILPTHPNILEPVDFDDSNDYYEETNVGWIGPTTVIGIVSLGSVSAVVLYFVQQRHKRRHVLVRTVQVCVSGATTRPTPSRLIQGIPQGPRWGPTTVFPPRIHQGVTIPAEFVSDDTNLIATDSLAAETTDHTPSSSSVPRVITSGAPPPYAEFSPTEGGQSVDEPPPPYPGP